MESPEQRRSQEGAGYRVIDAQGNVVTDKKTLVEAIREIQESNSPEARN